MLLSIIIPVYNVENVLEKSVENLVNQKVQDIEILLIDDGSTDNSGLICDKLQETYKNIIVWHQKNQGVSSARNVGIQQAIGEYVMFLDSDDYLDKNAIEIIIEKIKEKNADIISYGLKRVFTDGSVKETKLLFEQEKYFSCRKEIEEKVFPFVLENRIFMCCCVYKKEIIINNHILFERNLKYSEDYLFLLDNLKYCGSFIYIPKLFYNYFIGINISSNNYRGILDHICKEPECNYIHDRLKELKIFDKAKSDKSELISIHLALSAIYKEEGVKLVTSDVIRRLKLIKNSNVSFEDYPRNVRILLYFLENRYFYCYFTLLSLMKRKDRKRENFKLD